MEGGQTPLGPGRKRVWNRRGGYRSRCWRKNLGQVDCQLLVGRSVAVAVEVELEINEHLVGRLVAFVAIALERPLQDGLKLWIDVVAQRGELRHRHRKDVAAGLQAA